jgi:hypothetical protein
MFKKTLKVCIVNVFDCFKHQQGLIKCANLLFSPAPNKRDVKFNVCFLLTNQTFANLTCANKLIFSLHNPQVAIYL